MSIGGARQWFGGGVFALGSLFGWLLPISRPERGHELERERIGLATLTTPYLEGNGYRDSDAAMVAIRKDLEHLLQERRVSDSSLRVSVYVRDLLEALG